MTTGQRIAHYRTQQHLTRAALARAIDVDPSRLLRIERGEATPTVEQVAKLASVLGVKMEDLVVYA